MFCLCSCAPQLARVFGQIRRVCVQTGRQHAWCPDKRGAFEEPEGDGAGEPWWDHLGVIHVWLKKKFKLNVLWFSVFAYSAGGGGNKHTGGQGWHGGECGEIWCPQRSCPLWQTTSVPRVPLCTELMKKLFSCNASEVMSGKWAPAAQIMFLCFASCRFCISFWHYRWPLQMVAASTSCVNTAGACLQPWSIHAWKEHLSLKHSGSLSLCTLLENLERTVCFLSAPAGCCGAELLLRAAQETKAHPHHQTHNHPSVLPVCCFWQLSSLLSSPCPGVGAFH